MIKEADIEELKKRLEEEQILKRFVVGEIEATRRSAFYGLDYNGKALIRAYLEHLLIPIDFNIESLEEDIAKKESDSQN
jgi:hypothetical protein